MTPDELDRVREAGRVDQRVLRLRQAAAHLATGRPKIREVAGLTGSHDDATLSKAFKGEFGLAPGRYRASAMIRRRSRSSRLPPRPLTNVMLAMIGAQPTTRRSWSSASTHT